MAEIALQHKSKSDILQELNEREPADEIKEQVRTQAHNEGVPGVESGSIVTKYQLCGKYCQGCPHGPYAWLVQSETDSKDDWQYIGKVTGINGLEYYYDRDDEGNPEEVVIVGNGGDSQQTTNPVEEKQEVLERLESDTEFREDYTKVVQVQDLLNSKTYSQSLNLSSEEAEFIVENFNLERIERILKYSDEGGSLGGKEEEVFKILSGVQDEEFRELVTEYKNSEYDIPINVQELWNMKGEDFEDGIESVAEEELDDFNSHGSYPQKFIAAGILSSEDLKEKFESKMESYKDSSEKWSYDAALDAVQNGGREGDIFTISGRYKNGDKRFRLSREGGSIKLVEESVMGWDGPEWKFKHAAGDRDQGRLVSEDGDEINPKGLELDEVAVRNIAIYSSQTEDFELFQSDSIGLEEIDFVEDGKTGDADVPLQILDGTIQDTDTIVPDDYDPEETEPVGDFDGYFTDDGREVIDTNEGDSERVEMERQAVLNPNEGDDEVDAGQRDPFEALDRVSGIGPATEEELEEAGVETVGELYERKDEEPIQEILGNRVDEDDIAKAADEYDWDDDELTFGNLSENM